MRANPEKEFPSNRLFQESPANFLAALAPAIAALLVSSAFAIEFPPEGAPPAAVAAPAPEWNGEPRPAEDAVAESAYLGVVAGRVPEMLASHLGLAHGTGIFLQTVMPDSPAAKAGLALHDVITGVDNRPVGSSEDLTERINGYRPGDVIKLDLIREGVPRQIDATLEKRPVELAGPELRPLEQLKLDGIPKDDAVRGRKMIEGNIDEPMLGFEDNLDMAAPEVDNAMQELPKRMRDAIEARPIQMEQKPGGSRINQGATQRVMGDWGSIEFKSVDGGKEITARDPQGKIVWTGPWDTEQDKAAAPEEISLRVERLWPEGPPPFPHRPARPGPLDLR
jgi:serine protease Do